MNLAVPLLTAALGLSTFAAGPQPVRIQLNSLSILFHPASFKERFTQLVYVNQVTSAGDNPPNGELEFTSDPNIPATHQGTFVWQDGQTFEIFDMPFILDVPPDDSDASGLPDIVEFTPAASGVTSGQYVDLDGTVQDFTATWDKPANSHAGSCRFTISPFGSPQTFTHPIEIYEYTSSLPINASASTGVSTITVDMPRSGVDGEKLAGGLTLKFAQGQVTALASSALTNEVGAAFTWNTDSPSDLDAKKLYCFLDLIDGTPVADPNIPNDLDFNDWVLVIMDPNDSDGDGIPDIVDAAAATATAPRLEIVKTDNGIRLLIHGDVGRAYTLEDASALAAGTWSHATPVTISTDPQVLDLPAPTAPIFWRARFP
jgi:hypothetical protein